MVEPNNTTVSDNTESGALNMVKLIIDSREVVVPEHTTILDAAKSVSIQIPTLCYLRDLNEIGGCRVCVVEVEGCDQLVAACNNYVLDGMVVHTNSPKAREARRTNVQLLLSQHDAQCASCVRSGNCNLQTIANDLGKSKGLHPSRRANLMDGFGSTLPAVIPVTSAFIFIALSCIQGLMDTYSFVQEVSPVSLAGASLHCWFLFVVLAVAVITGWGRKYEGPNGEPVKALPAQTK